MFCSVCRAERQALHKQGMEVLEVNLLFPGLRVVFKGGDRVVRNVDGTQVEFTDGSTADFASRPWVPIRVGWSSPGVDIPVRLTHLARVQQCRQAWLDAQRETSEAADACYRAVIEALEAGVSHKELAKFLNVTRQAVTFMAARGRQRTRITGKIPENATERG